MLRAATEETVGAALARLAAEKPANIELVLVVGEIVYFGVVRAFGL